MPVVDTSRKLKIIDTDTHLSEPHDLWLRRAPARLRERVPQVKMRDGQMSWVIDGDKVIGEGANPTSAIRANGEKATGLSFLNWSIDEVHPGSYDAKARLKMMDEAGVWAQIVYPNILGFGGQRSAKVDPALRLAVVQIYNDAMAELQAESGERLFPMALPPWWNVDEAVVEIERCADMGLRGININSDPHGHTDESGAHLHDLAEPYWNPMWEVCQDRGLPVNFHIGGSEQVIDWFGMQGWPSLAREQRAVIGGAMMNMNNGRVMANIIMSGLLDRYPRLKFVSVESGIGWIPGLMEALDYQHLEFGAGGTIERAPSAYFASNIWACFWFETRNRAHSIRAVGVDNVMFETDFPHPTCLFPLDADLLAMPDLTSEEREKVLSRNAAGVYGAVD